MPLRSGRARTFSNWSSAPHINRGDAAMCLTLRPSFRPVKLAITRHPPPSSDPRTCSLRVFRRVVECSCRFDLCHSACTVEKPSDSEDDSAELGRTKACKETRILTHLGTYRRAAHGSGRERTRGAHGISTG